MNPLEEGEHVDIFNGGGGLCLQLEQCTLGQLDQFLHHLLGFLRHDLMDCLGKEEEKDGAIGYLYRGTCNQSRYQLLLAVSFPEAQQ